MRHLPMTTKRMLNLATLAVAGGCLASLPSFAAQQDRPSTPAAAAQAQPAGDRAMLPKGIKWETEMADADDVRGVIDDVAGAAVIDGGFDDVVERFVDQDRNRFGEWMDEGENREFTEFNAAARRFQEAYKAKFNEEFDFDAETALAGVTAYQGEVEDPQMVATNWPVKPMIGMGGDGAEPRMAGDEQRDPTTADGNIEEGREVAIATIPAPMHAMKPGMHGDAHKGMDKGMEPGMKPADQAAKTGMEHDKAHAMKGHGIQVSLVNELPGAWKIDVPNSRRPEQVYTDLTQRIDTLTQHADAWPSDMAQVQQIVAHEVLCAIYGVDMHKPGMDKPAGMDATPRGAGMNGAADRPQGGGSGMGGGGGR